MAVKKNVDLFVEWAKARLDEMSADAATLDANLAQMDSDMRAQGEKSVKQVNDWVAQGQAKIAEVQSQGSSAIAGGQEYINQIWDQFQTQADSWAENAQDQHAAFQARADAQVQSWQKMVDSYTKMAADIHSQHKAEAEAQLVELKKNAQTAQAQLNSAADQFKSAGETTWAAFRGALNDSREAFSKAVEMTDKSFDEAQKKK